MADDKVEVQRTQAQMLLTAGQYGQFKQLQLRLSDTTRLGTPQPAKATVVIDRMLAALEAELDQGN